MIKTFLYSLLLSFLPLFTAAGDELATSVMKTLEKIFSDRDLNEYDGFVKTLIKEMLEDDTFFFVMSDRNVRKLAQIMAASEGVS